MQNKCKKDSKKEEEEIIKNRKREREREREREIASESDDSVFGVLATKLLESLLSVGMNHLKFLIIDVFSCFPFFA